MLAELENICRLCLEKCGKDCWSVLENSVHSKIMLCLNMEIQTTDNMPKQICKNCRYQLEKSYLFRTTSKISERKLRKHIRLINNGSKSVLIPPSAKSINDENEDDDIYEFNQNMLESYKYFENIEKQKEALLKTSVQDFEKDKKKFYESTEKKFELEFKELKQKLEKEEKEFRKKEVEKIFDKMKKFIQTETEAADTSNSITNVKPETDDDGDAELSEVLEVYEEDEDSVMEVDTKYKVLDNDPLTSKSAVIIQKEDGIILNRSADKKLRITEPIKLVVYGNKAENAILSDEGDNHEKGVEYFTIEHSENDDLKYVGQVNKNKNYEIFSVVEEADENAENVENDAEKSGSNKKPDKDDYFITIDEMEAGTDKNGEKLIFKCAKCEMKFSRRKPCKLHYLTHMTDKGFKCNYCDKMFQSKSAHVRHVRIHTLEKPFKCTQCSKSFAQNEVLKRHLVTHSDDYIFSCDFEGCVKKFKSKDLLKQHIKTHSKDNEQFACKFCEKKFHFASGLSRHMLVHSGRTYSCEQCDKSFNDYSSLKRHMKYIHNSSEN